MSAQKSGQDREAGEHPMNVEAGRRFNLGDAMIFVAAMAIATLAIRVTLPDLSILRYDILRSGSEAGMRGFLVIQYGLSAFNPYLASLTAAWLIVRLRRPRPGLRRVGRQPGMVACVAASVAMAIEAVWIGSLIAVRSRFVDLSTLFVGYAQEPSFAVVGGWCALAMSGRWRPEASWIDRLGRILGLAWVGTTVLSWSRYFLI